MNSPSEPDDPSPDEAATIIGGFAEREAAHNIDPAAEHAYWQKHFSSRPYVDPGESFADYGPAYDYGIASASDYGGRTFDGVEAELSRSWEQRRGTSTLTWQRAQYAVRDAWERVHTLVYGDRLT